MHLSVSERLPEQENAAGGRWLNLLEPVSLPRAFCDHPSEGFEPFCLPVGGGGVFGFAMRYDLLTTMDKPVKEQWGPWLARLPGWLSRALKPPVVFIGSPTTEYTLFPAETSVSAMAEGLLKYLKESSAAGMIVKDIPCASPLLSDAENAYAEALQAELSARGFLTLSGQALAYLPVDFPSVEAYIGRFSAKRRSDFKRKLKSFDQISVRVLNTGDPSLDTAMLSQLYRLYENVYEKSYIHFEKLTRPFFCALFTDPGNNGRIFLYYLADRLIGFNLGFVLNGMLVEKYVGYTYPEARTHNLYFLAWFYRLQYCLDHGLHTVIAGWTNPEIKAYLGARFTQTRHAVYVKNPVLRALVTRFRFLLEADAKFMSDQNMASLEAAG